MGRATEPKGKSHWQVGIKWGNYSKEGEGREEGKGSPFSKGMGRVGSPACLPGNTQGKSRGMEPHKGGEGNKGGKGGGSPGAWDRKSQPTGKAGSPAHAIPKCLKLPVSMGSKWPGNKGKRRGPCWAGRQVCPPPGVWHVPALLEWGG